MSLVTLRLPPNIPQQKVPFRSSSGTRGLALPQRRHTALRKSVNLAHLCTPTPGAGHGARVRAPGDSSAQDKTHALNHSPWHNCGLLIPVRCACASAAGDPGPSAQAPRPRDHAQTRACHVPIGPENECIQECGSTERRQRMYTRSGSAFGPGRCASMHAALSAFPERKVLRTCTRGFWKVSEGQHNSAPARWARCLSLLQYVVLWPAGAAAFRIPSSVLQVSALE